MAENVGEKVSEVLDRVRDPQGSHQGRSRASVVDLLSQCQRLINAKTGIVVGSASLGLNGQQLFYSPISALLSSAAAVIGVRYNGSNLERTTVEELRAIDSSWFRRVDSEPSAFTVIGREILVIYPAVEFNDIATVDYVSITTDFVGEESSFTMADQDVPDVLDLTEIILLAQQRDHAMISGLLQLLVSKLAIKEREHG